MEIVIRIVVWAIIAVAILMWLGSHGSSGSDFDSKDPGGDVY